MLLRWFQSLPCCPSSESFVLAELWCLSLQIPLLQAMLYNIFDEGDEKRKKLAALIRLFVNLLRSGKLVTTDIVRCEFLGEMVDALIVKSYRFHKFSSQ